VDVALVVADAELAADLGAVVGETAPVLPRNGRGGRLRLLRERLGDLAVVAVDGDRLDAEPPGVGEEPGDLVDRRLLGEVDRLRDRPRDEGPGG
jgi:hypothetical protein